MTAQENVWTPVLVPISTAFFIWDVLRSNRWEQFDPVFILHHVLCILLWNHTVIYGVGSYILLWFMTYELSTPFIHIRWACLTFLGPTLPYQLTTACFAIAYLIIRVAHAPFLLEAFYTSKPWNTDLYEYPHWMAYSYAIAFPFPAFLNIYWFWLIIQMGLRSSKPKDKTKTK
jgi:hypothetical protein